MTKFEHFNKFWFTHDGSTVEIYDKTDLSRPIDTATISEFEYIADNPEILEDTEKYPEQMRWVDILKDFKKYQTRPEWLVGKQIDKYVDFSAPENNSIETLKNMYVELLIGTICLRAFQSIKDVSQGEALAEKIINYLESTDFFQAPASTIYHEAVPSGLLFHSLKVYNEAVTLQILPAFQNCHICKWSLAALVHDWCKIGLYESYTRNVKNEMTGQWEKVPSFKVATTKRNNTMGHGTASMFMISQFVKLSYEEALAIRWHMGTWNVCDSEMNDLQDANEMYPLVHMLQFADQLAVTKYETKRYRKSRTHT